MFHVILNNILLYYFLRSHLSFCSFVVAVPEMTAPFSKSGNAVHFFLLFPSGVFLSSPKSVQLNSDHCTEHFLVKYCISMLKLVNPVAVLLFCFKPLEFYLKSKILHVKIIISLMFICVGVVVMLETFC